MSKPMNLSDLVGLYQHVMGFHSPFTRDHGKTVKYMEPVIDMRTGELFAIRFRGPGWEETLRDQSAYSNLPKSLYDRCMEFLDE